MYFAVSAPSFKKPAYEDVTNLVYAHTLPFLEAEWLLMQYSRGLTTKDCERSPLYNYTTDRNEFHISSCMWYTFESYCVELIVSNFFARVFGDYSSSSDYSSFDSDSSFDSCTTLDDY
jgi:hypothetical protein